MLQLKPLSLNPHFNFQKGTIVTVEGPRFSTKAESLMFRAWGADVINMTTVPEVRKKKESEEKREEWNVMTFCLCSTLLPCCG